MTSYACEVDALAYRLPRQVGHIGDTTVLLMTALNTKGALVTEALMQRGDDTGCQRVRPTMRGHHWDGTSDGTKAAVAALETVGGGEIEWCPSWTSRRVLSSAETHLKAMAETRAVQFWTQPNGGLLREAVIHVPDCDGAPPVFDGLIREWTAWDLNDRSAYSFRSRDWREGIRTCGFDRERDLAREQGWLGLIAQPGMADADAAAVLTTLGVPVTGPVRYGTRLGPESESALGAF
ncbi:MAG: hypothetical protein RJQ08_11640 [Salinisphaeraceae bacterium]